MKSEQLEKLEYLFLRYCEGSISKSEMDKLNSAMLKSESIRKRYFDFLKTELALSRCLEQNFLPDENSVLLKELEKMADYEKTAPEVQVSHEAPKRELIQNVSREKIEYKVNWSSLYLAAASIAAIVFIILFIHYVPPKREAQIASLLDTIDAEWGQTDLPLDIGSGLSVTDGTRHLLKGYIKVGFSSGAEVIIEGPAEFELKSSDHMNLNKGKLYANISGHSSGFTVNTPSSKIVDLGTQFGVNVEPDGTSDLHMFKGRAIISAQVRDGTKSVKEVIKGFAMRVSPSPERIEKIQFKDQVFVREISSASRLVWKGEPINLVDLACGGGFSSLNGPIGMNPLKGDRTSRLSDNGSSSNAYVSVAWNPYVDGVFVPNGMSPQIISSQQHRFTGCPVTNSSFHSNIGILNPDNPVELSGITYGTIIHPALFMSGNLGITFDLEPVRQVVPDEALLIFRSKVGVGDSALSGDCDVDFWVLVDGEVRFQRSNVRKRGVCGEIELELEQGARFLTLVTIDNHNASMQADAGRRDGDWCLFAEPRIDVHIHEDKFITHHRVLIDLGPSNDDDGRATTSPDVNGNYWNSWRPLPGNMPITIGETFPEAIIDITNKPTPFLLEMTNSFDSNGRVNGGLLSPDAALLGDFAIPTATEDYWFESVDGGALRISGLDPARFYDVRMFGSRESTSTRTTRYTVVDAYGSQFVDLQTSGKGIGTDGYDGNNDKIVGFANLVPTIDGEIHLDVSIVEGGYAYLGILEIIEKSKVPDSSN